ncbi:formate/nitrite transporter family protein [Halarchaeum sp. P4]|uniref:formate/nitrite transporter family protein n=1 Tax=Halarchaeum sp. P4 TaxID=3421639 RepID=UPI003EBD8CFB
MGASETDTGSVDDSTGHVRSQEEVLAAQLDYGLDELRRPTDGLLLSGVSAGLDVGFGPLFMAALYSVAAGVWSAPTLELTLGVLYATGFVFVVLGRAALFTEHTTLAVVPVLDGRATVRSLLRLWGVVYLGNAVGGAVFALAMVAAAPAYGIVDPAAFVHLAEPLVSHPWYVTLVAAVLAGWLMGLLSWLVTAVRDATTQLALVVLVTTVIGFGHLPHAVAGTVEVLAGAFVAPTITLADYARFVVLAVLGNAVGGSVFVALLKYGYVVRGQRE